jgi:hypothetical protein
MIRCLIGLMLAVLLVQAAEALALEKRFVVKSEGLVLDKKTNLMWLQDAGDPAFHAPIQIANTIVKEMNSRKRKNYGYSDWRIPTLDELRSLVDSTRAYPALPAGHSFKNVKPEFYWTSTGGVNIVGYAWAVDMSTGAIKYDYASYCTFHWFLPVRSAGKVKLEHKVAVATAPTSSELDFLVREESCVDVAKENLPDVPADFTASAVSPDEIILSWKAGTGKDLLYIVYNTEGRVVRSVGAPPVSITGLPPASEACFAVKAQHPSGLESPISRRVCTKTWSKVARGTVWSIGQNNYGQLGDGTRSDAVRMMQAKDISGISAISAGVEHAAAVTEEGSLWAWGSNSRGQIGDGTTRPAVVPVKVKALSDVVDVSLGWYHTVVLTSKGKVWAWGRNYYNQIGDGTGVDRISPVEVSSLPPVSKISAGWYHTLALLKDGTLMAWGWNRKGQLGIGDESQIRKPEKVVGPKDIKGIAAGMYHSLALGKDGSVWAWGSNEFGQIGEGSAGNAYIPFKVEGVGKVKDITAGMSYSLALLEDGTVWGWGRNDYGQLGSEAPKSPCAWLVSMESRQ